MVPGGCWSFLDFIITVVSTLQECKTLRPHYCLLGSNISQPLSHPVSPKYISLAFPNIYVESRLFQLLSPGNPLLSPEISSLCQAVRAHLHKRPKTVCVGTHCLATFWDTGLNYFLPNKPWIKMTTTCIRTRMISKVLIFNPVSQFNSNNGVPWSLPSHYYDLYSSKGFICKWYVIITTLC